MTISVIIATWNSAKTISNTIESIYRQTWKEIEVIVVDGQSTDNTVEIVKEYEGRFGGRLRWISEPDRGLYDAMNKGIAMATGDVVGILNSDDFYTSDDVLERVAREIDGVDAVYGDIHFVNPDDLSKCVRYYSSRSFRRWQMRLGFMPAHPSFYCRRRVYQSLGAFDLQFKVAADFEQLLRLIYINRISTKYIPMDFVTMRTGGASTSGLQSHKAILRDHLRAYRKNGVKANIATESLR
ncbi:MAG: glycosyltransferase, partial [Paramuribaculum sp.]|nr:glycosyltransferase [Paramuribaculum sp.]